MAIATERSGDLLIGGALVPGGGGRFPTINPATEEVLGTAADADAGDMDRAIDAARRAFDDTDWSRDAELRVHCIRQLREAMLTHIEQLREITIAEAGAPRMLTAAAQLQGPVTDLAFAACARGLEILMLPQACQNVGLAALACAIDCQQLIAIAMLGHERIEYSACTLVVGAGIMEEIERRDSFRKFTFVRV